MLEKKKQIKRLFLEKNRKKMNIYLVLCHKSLTFALAIVPWCNGSTTDFGSASGGSSPPGTTTIFVKPLKVKYFQGLYFLRDLFWFPVYGIL